MASEGHRDNELIALGHGGTLPPHELTPVHEIVTRLAHARPADIAVCSGGTSVSYGALEAWSSRIAAQLAAVGVDRGCRVGVLTEPSAAMVAATLAILRRGAAYVPVDPAQPDRRIGETLADADVTGVVVDGEVDARRAGRGVPVVRTGAVETHAGGGLTAMPSVVPVAGDDAAYVIYTSGSTGEPKGVLVEHGQLAASTLARRRVYPGRSVFLLVSSLAFDSSVAGLWGTLTAGGCLIVATSEELRDPGRLVGLVESRQVTRMLCVPSLYSVFLDAAEHLGGRRLRSLDTVITAGEPLPETLLTRHFAVHSETVHLVNEYGPTEATVWASYKRFDAPGPVSIGGPVPGTSLYVLDDELRLVPRGAEGELFIGGAGVSRGYLGRADATTRAFIADPFAGMEGARMYRTGDLVRWNDDDTLGFLGRRDDQVKIRGHRVELGAVEAALRTVPGIRDAVVLPDGDCARLTGFVLAPAGVEPERVREHVADRLPAVMVPARIQVLDSFPLTISGKVDRNTLRATADEGSSPEPPQTAAGASTTVAAATAEDGIVVRVAAAWAEVLSLSAVPIEVNFVDLGGHSLAMFKLQDALERHTGTRPSIVELFRRTTVSAQAALIRDGVTAPDDRLTGRRSAAARRSQAARARRQHGKGETAR
jgi:amino acid adenylation domain-containing protein